MWAHKTCCQFITTWSNKIFSICQQINVNNRNCVNYFLQLRYFESQAELVLNKTVGYWLGICWQGLVLTGAVLGVSVQSVMTSWAEQRGGHSWFLQSYQSYKLIQRKIYKSVYLLLEPSHFLFLSLDTPNWESDSMTPDVTVSPVSSISHDVTTYIKCHT